mgnify:CR=1 FL=1
MKKPFHLKPRMMSKNVNIIKNTSTTQAIIITGRGRSINNVNLIVNIIFITKHNVIQDISIALMC